MTVLKPLVYCLLPIAILFFVSCTPGKKELRPSKPLPRADEIIKGLKVASERVSSLKGIATVRVGTGEKNANIKEVIIVKRHGKIRAETIGLFGSPIFIVAVNNSNIALYDTVGNRFLRGDKASQEILIPLGILGAEEVTDLLLGGTPFIKYENVNLVYKEAKKVYILTLNSQNGEEKQVISVDAETLLLRSSEIMDRGRGTTLSLEFSNYQEIEGISFPKEIRVRASDEFNNRTDTLHISYEDIELNKDIADELFDLAPPENSDGE